MRLLLLSLLWLCGRCLAQGPSVGNTVSVGPLPSLDPPTSRIDDPVTSRDPPSSPPDTSTSPTASDTQDPTRSTQTQTSRNAPSTSTSIETVVVPPSTTSSERPSSSAQPGRHTSLSARIESAAGASAVVVIANLTTTVPAELASSIAEAASSSLAAALQNGDNANGGSGGGLSTGAIVGIVVPSVLLGLALLAFLLWKLSQRRSAAEAIKWPEMKASDDGSSILMPVGVHRTAGAGVGDEEPEMRETLSAAAPSAMMPQAPYYEDRAQAYGFEPFTGAEYPHSATTGDQSDGGVSRRPSNTSLGGGILPPGATHSHTHLLDPAEQPGAEYAYYNSSPDSATPTSPLSSTRSSQAMLDRNGTLRSSPSESSGRVLGLANPDRDAPLDR